MLNLIKMIEQDIVRAGKCTNGAKMTKEEALATQHRMFVAARTMMNSVAAAPKPPKAGPSLSSKLFPNKVWTPTKILLTTILISDEHSFRFVRCIMYLLIFILISDEHSFHFVVNVFSK